MTAKISGLLIVISFFFALITGSMEALSDAILSGCEKAVSLTLSLLGLMGLWNGLLACAGEGGLLDAVARLLSPLLRFLFPDAWQKKHGIREISALLTANLLGVGNASTPLALSAMQALRENQKPDEIGTASRDMVTLTLLGTACPSLIPTTVIALRRNAGSTAPLDIIPAVWLCSLVLTALTVLLAKLPQAKSKRKGTAP